MADGGAEDAYANGRRHDRRSLGKGDKVAVKFYLLDNSTKTLVIRNETTAASITRALAGKLGFDQPERDHRYFGIYQAKCVHAG